MTIEQFVRLAARLFAVWLLLAQGIHMALIVFTPDASPGMEKIRNAYTVGLVLLSLCAVFLWFFPAALSRGIFTKQDLTNRLTTKFSLEELQQLCFSVLGLWFATTALFYLLQLSDNIADILRADPQSHNFKLALRMLVPYLVQLAVGIWLFVGGRGLGGFVNWLRNMPRQSPLE